MILCDAVFLQIVNPGPEFLNTCTVIIQDCDNPDKHKAVSRDVRDAVCDIMVKSPSGLSAGFGRLIYQSTV